MALDHLSEDTRDQLAQLALNLSANPKTRKSFLGIVKEHAPNTPIPELDSANEFRGELDKRDKELSELKNELATFKATQNLSALKNGVMEKHSLSASDIGKMEEMMTKKELPADYEFAARLYKQQIEPVGSTAYAGDFGPVSMPNDEGLMENESNWSLRTAHSIIDDMRRTGKKPF